MRRSQTLRHKPTLIYNIYYTTISPPLALLQKLLRLIHLRRQVRTPSSIGVIKQHQLPVIFADLVFCKISLAVILYISNLFH